MIAGDLRAATQARSAEHRRRSNDSHRAPWRRLDDRDRAAETELTELLTPTCTASTPRSRLAIEAGYFDQAHFIRALRAVTGAPPGRFFRVVEHC